MAYGFQSINASDFVQIDQDFSNYVVVQRGTYTWNNQFCKVPIPYYGVIPLILVRNPTPYFATMYSIELVGITYNATGNYANIYLNEAPNGTTMEVMVCVPAYVVSFPTATHGLRVYRGDGSVAFDSLQEGPRIVGVYSASLPSVRGSYGLLTFSPANSNPWISLNSAIGSLSVEKVGTQGYQLYMSVRLYSSTQVQISMQYASWMTIYSNVTTTYGDVPCQAAVLGNLT